LLAKTDVRITVFLIDCAPIDRSAMGGGELRLPTGVESRFQNHKLIIP
jgi:hypothetical protein